MYLARLSPRIALYPFLWAKPFGHNLTVKKLHNSQKLKKKGYFSLLDVVVPCNYMLLSVGGYSTNLPHFSFSIDLTVFLMDSLITVAFSPLPSLYLLFKVIFSLSNYVFTVHP